MTNRFKSKRPSPWWILGPSTVAAIMADMVNVSFTDLYGDFLCRSKESGHELAEECTSSPHHRLGWLGNVFLAQWLSTIILSWLARYWFGSLSDRYGRTRVLAVANACSSLASMPTIFAQLVLTKRVTTLYRLIIPCVIVQSALRGMAEGVGTLVTQAYLIDTAAEMNRSSILSFSLGLLYLKPLALTFIHMRFGWKLSTSSLHILLAAQVFFTLYVWRVVPESMSEDEQTRARESYKSARGAETRNLSQKIKSFASLINPFALLGPTATNTHGGPLRHDGKDWSLTLFVLGLSLPLLGVHISWAWIFDIFSDLTPNPYHSSPYWVRNAQAIVLLVFFPVMKKALNLVGVSQGSIQEGFHSIRGDLKTGRFLLGLVFTSVITVSLICPDRDFVRSLSEVLKIPAVIFQPALISVIASTYARKGGKEIGRLLCGVMAIEEICKFIGLRLLLRFVSCPPTSVIFRSAILAASCYCLFRGRVTEVPLDLHAGDEHDSEKQARVVGKE